MKRESRQRQSEQGSVIVMALMVLMLITLLGITSTTTNVTEHQIVRNEAIYKRNFYRAEGAATEASMGLENADFADDLTVLWTDPALNWVHNIGTTFTNGDTDSVDNDGDGYVGLYDTDNWLVSGSTPTGDVSTSARVGNTSYYAALYVGTEGSLKPGAPKIHIFRNYGYCNDQGESMVAAGYRKPVN
jgi:Tfp pilus assembly protein PilX